MVKVTAPCLSLSNAPPLRKKRTPWGQTIHTPPVEHVLVTAGDPAPDPDCTGLYVYDGDINSEHAYRRTTEPIFYLYKSVGWETWIISTNNIDDGSTIWYNELSQSGTYEPGPLPVTGNPIASAPTF